MKTHNFSTHAIWTAVVALLGAGTIFAAAPLGTAKVTRVENKVTLGKIEDGKAGERRPAEIADVVKADNFIQTKSDSKAELQFRDRSLVRVGHNSIFSFQSGTRTLSLEKGEMLFYIVPGKGGATIKTPTLTAAVTGTTVYQNANLCVVLEGSLALKDENGNPLRDALGNPITLTAGAGINAVELINGNWVPKHVDPASVTPLVALVGAWPLPDNVRAAIYATNPGLGTAVANAGQTSGNGGGGGGGPVGTGSLTSSPIFGGGSPPVTTGSNP